MLKTVDVILVVAMLSAASWTFAVKHQAGIYEDALRDIDRQIAQERDTIALLEADLSMLGQPMRLQRLADSFEAELALAPLRPEQIVSQDELPAPPVKDVPAEGEAGGQGTQELAAASAGGRTVR